MTLTNKRHHPDTCLSSIPPDGEGIGKLAVVDWGLATERGDRATITGRRFLGTRAFMAYLSGCGKLSNLRCRSDLTEPHALDDVGPLLYLIEFLHAADVPWGWPGVTPWC